jgi:hypothetical protein
VVLRGDIVGGKLLGSINGLCDAQRGGGERYYEPRRIGPTETGEIN